MEDSRLMSTAFPLGRGNQSLFFDGPVATGEGKGVSKSPLEDAKQLIASLIVDAVQTVFGSLSYA